MTSVNITGNHDNLSSNKKHQELRSSSKANVALAKLGGGTVILRIWPAVLLHTVFAALIVVLSNYTPVKLDIPNIMLTLLGVVIGFVISLRVSSGYDRYWWGRCAWSDLVKNSRTISRLIWIHVPPRLEKMGPTVSSHLASGSSPTEEIGQVMREKRMMIDLVQAFAISIKHYVRGELGIYYEDMYEIVRPFHEHKQHPRNLELEHSNDAGDSSTTAAEKKASGNTPDNSSQIKLSIPTPETALIAENPSIPPVNSYGSTKQGKSRSPNSLKHVSSNVSLGSSTSSIREPLLPADLRDPDSSPSSDLIPFWPFFIQIACFINPFYWYVVWKAHRRDGFEGDEESRDIDGHERILARSHRSRRRAARQIHRVRGKHRPRLAGDGENLPLEIIRCMSQWVYVLESREVASGSTIGGLYGCLATYEDILGTLERILTTPLPYVYSQHIRHTVWLYLFFLPFQLAADFHWYTVPGVAVAAFFYLGFLAAGDEIEQPFGYDENDLDLDLFCREVIQADLHTLVTTPCPNAPTGSQHLESDIIETRTVVELSLEKGRHMSKNVGTHTQR